MAEQGRAQGRTQGYAGTWPPRGAGGRHRAIRSRRLAFADRQVAHLDSRRSGRGRLLPWVPVAFGTGIGLCFTADREPVLPVVALVATGLCAAAVLLRRQKIFPVAVMIAAIAAGFAIATWKTARVAHGVLARPMYSVSLSGFVQTRDIRERTDRFVLRVAHMESPRSQVKLERVPLSVRKGTASAVGRLN